MTIHANKDLAMRLETIEALNQVEYAITCDRLRKDIQAAYKKIGTGYAVYAGVDSPLTQSFALGLDGPVSEEEIMELETFFTERGAAANVEVCNLSDIGLARSLVERGYQISEYSNLFVKPLKDASPFEAHAESFIRQVRVDEAEIFAETVCNGFIEDAEPPGSMIDLFKLWFSQANCTLFGAYVDGELAGGGAAFLNGGVAELGGASTLPKHRNEGIQTALLKARVNYAISKGCDLAMVTTLPGTISQHNVEKQGFQIMYSRTKFTKPFEKSR